MSAAAAAAASPCPVNGATCSGCAACDSLYLPPGRVQDCSMGGDPFILASLRPPHAGPWPVLYQVGSYWWFQTLFGMSTLLKCYYSAFYFSYAIGRATV